MMRHPQRRAAEPTTAAATRTPAKRPIWARKPEKKGEKIRSVHATPFPLRRLQKVRNAVCVLSHTSRCTSSPSLYPGSPLVFAHRPCANTSLPDVHRGWRRHYPRSPNLCSPGHRRKKSYTADCTFGFSRATRRPLHFTGGPAETIARSEHNPGLCPAPWSAV